MNIIVLIPKHFGKINVILNQVWLKVLLVNKLNLLIKTNQFKKELLSIPKYETKNLELYQPTRTTKEINIDTLLTSLFRNDVYLGAKDYKSHALLKPVRAHRQFREKYYANPVYKALVNLDMRPFLAGQPKSL